MKKSIIIIFITVTLCMAVFGFWLIYNHQNVLVSVPIEASFGTVTIRGISMSPVLQDGQEIQVDYGFYKNNAIQANDIVLIEVSWQEDPIVKFIKAVPQDTIALLEAEDERYNILVNSKVLGNSENELYSFSYAHSRMLNLFIEEYKGVIPKGFYLALGNQPSGTRDSTKFGLVKQEDVIAKVVDFD